jgi:acylphosphatase
MVRKTVLYSGHVQGVAFRFTTCRVAGGFHVTGWVRNLADGRVEMVAEGEEGELSRFLDGVSEAMRGHISDIEVSQSPATGEFADFTIRR